MTAVLLSLLFSSFATAVLLGYTFGALSVDYFLRRLPRRRYLLFAVLSATGCGVLTVLNGFLLSRIFP